MCIRDSQTTMLDFAEKSDGNEADRTAEGFARMFGNYFPPEFSITEGNAWMSTLNNSVPVSYTHLSEAPANHGWCFVLSRIV